MSHVLDTNFAKIDSKNSLKYFIFQKFDFSGVVGPSPNIKITLGDRTSDTNILTANPTKDEMQTLIDEVLKKRCTFSIDPYSKLY